jgi:hypothetical protein
MKSHAQAGRDGGVGGASGRGSAELSQIVATAVLNVTNAVDARARKHLAVDLVQGVGVTRGASEC